MKVFTLMWDVLKDFEVFEIHFQRSEAFVLKCGAFLKIKRFLKDIFREVKAFFN
jgi:hypothetical protein